MIRKTLLAAIGLVTLGTAVYSAPAEAGRITVVNNAGIVARVKWKVDSSESGWTTLALGSSTFRDYPENYPNINLEIQFHTGFNWKSVNCNRSSLPPSRSWNVELKGTAFSFTCKAE